MPLDGWSQGAGESWTPDDLEGLTVERYSKSQVVKAGDIIRAKNDYPPTQEALDAFQLAHKWRIAHVWPMRRARQELGHKAGKLDIGAVTAGRLKRFQSIRRKLQRRSYNLYRIQDIAGCRAIVPTIQEAEALAAVYRAGGSKHVLAGEDDYIAAPKVGGYRSFHFILRYTGDAGQTAGNRLTFEVQIRTQLQHAWATAVEAVGLVRDEELKSGIGDADWLRFFEIMASEFAIEEGRPVVPTVTTNAQARLDELSTLERKLGAIKKLESYNQAISRANEYLSFTGSSFLIKYDLEKQSIEVMASRRFSAMADKYQEEERNQSSNTVLVEVDKVGDLAAAYPNYFLDVKDFTDRLKAVVRGTMKPRAPLERDSFRRNHSLSWRGSWHTLVD